MEKQGKLTLGELQQRTLPPQTSHLWSITLEQGQYAVLEVFQKSMNVLVRLVDPRGVREAKFNNPTEILGKKKVAWIAHTDGIWKVEIMLMGLSQSGDYEIQWTIARVATETDRKTVQADSLNTQALRSKLQGQFVEAEQLLQRSRALFENALGPDHPEVATSLSNLALLHSDQGKYAEAELLFKHSLAIREQALGPNHLDVATSLNELAELYRTRGKYAEAAPLYERSLAIREKTLGPAHPQVGASLNNLALLCHAQGRYAEAEQLYSRSGAIYEKALDPHDPELARSLENHAWLYLLQGRYTETEPFLTRALEIKERVLGSDHYETAMTFEYLAGLYGYQGKYSQAEQLHKRALTIREKTLGAHHPEVARSLNNVASLYHLQGRYSEAKSLYERSLSMVEKVLEPDHPNVAGNLNNLAMLLQNQGNYAVAESLYKCSLVIREKALGMDHPDVGESLVNLAYFYSIQGKNSEAEPLYKRGLAILQQALGPDHLNVAKGLNNLALLYDAQGKYAEAQLLFKRSQAIRERSLGRDHPEVATSLNNQATFYYSQGKYAEAESLLMLSHTIMEKHLGPNHPNVATSLNNLAFLYAIQGKYSEAEPLYRKSLAMREKALGPNHPEVAASLNNLAWVMFLEGEKDVENAWPLIERVIRILQTTPGDPDWRVAAFALRSRLHKRNGDLNRALADLAEALHAAEEARPQIGGGEETRAGLFEQYADHFNRMVAWQLEAGQIEKALEYAERGKARVLLDQLAAGKIDLRASIPADQRASLEKRESDAKARLAEYQQRIIALGLHQDLSDEERIRQLAKLQDSLRQAYYDYQQIHEEMKNASQLWQGLITSAGKPASLEAIQNRLVSQQSLMLIYQIGKEESFLFIITPAGQKAEVMRLQFTDKVASVLEMKAGSLKSTDLQKILSGHDMAQTAGGLIQQLNKSSRGVRPIAAAKARTLARLHALWQLLVPKPLWPRLAQCAEVILVPDDVLHVLPFEALVLRVGEGSTDAHYWLDEGPVIRYAPSATTLYNIEQSQDQRSRPTISHATVLSLADPIYNPAEVARGLQQETTYFASASGTNRSAESFLDELDKLYTRDRYERAGGSLARLPGTVREAEEISRAFASQDTKARVFELRQLDANEPNLRAGLLGKRYIHLATHGLVDQQSQALLASLALTPPPGEATHAEDDGFLQLYEIYELKLPACELAVLSACQTNAGHNFAGEGVFALSRGFLAAGARRVIASQWSVDDASTAELIGEFFRQIAAAEKKGGRIDYALALRDAKRKVRNQKPWIDPYYWAPFILTGKQ